MHYIILFLSFSILSAKDINYKISSINFIHRLPENKKGAKL